MRSARNFLNQYIPEVIIFFMNMQCDVDCGAAMWSFIPQLAAGSSKGVLRMDSSQFVGQKCVICRKGMFIQGGDSNSISKNRCGMKNILSPS